MFVDPYTHRGSAYVGFRSRVSTSTLLYLGLEGNYLINQVRSSNEERHFILLIIARSSHLLISAMKFALSKYTALWSHGLHLKCLLMRSRDRL